MKAKILVTTLVLALCSTLSFAEHSVPVYDVDSMSNDAPVQQNQNIVQQNNSANPATSSSATALPVTTSSAVPVISSAPTTPPLSMEQRMARLEHQFENVQQNDASKHLADLQGEVQALRGQIEEMSHRLQELASQHADMGKQQSTEPTFSALSPEGNEDVIKTKMLRTKQATGVAANKADNTKKPLSSREKGPSAVNQPNVAEEQAVYQTAYNLIKVKKYNEAIGALQKMLSKYPSGQFAANAHYWLGELYSLTGQHEQASAEFTAVVKHYPTNPRVADAELKLGLIYATQLKWLEAKTAFNKVVHKFPGTASAQLAMEQLKQLKQAGH